MNLGIAVWLAADVFKDKTDKAGEPYILHCIRVMNEVDSDEEKMVAVLHDVEEDTKDSEPASTRGTPANYGTPSW